ncbi:MAG: MoaD/ThiS family protein [Planctomycetota bacterium]|nr:MoaD/ThiS family protein [Planctomycetota bacterium]
MKIQISYTGRSYQAASLLPAEITLDDGATVDDALCLLKKDLSDDQQLPGSCLVAVSGEHIGTLTNYTNRPLRDRDELILIAPVAGG